MQFHHHGYVSGDPRIQPVAGVGVDRPAELPDFVDVLIVGTGPAGMITAAQLSQFPGVTTRIIDRAAKHRRHDSTVTAGHLPLRQRVLRMAVETRVVDSLDLRVLFQEPRYRQRIRAVPIHPQRQGFYSAQNQEGVERP